MKCDLRMIPMGYLSLYHEATLADRGHLHKLVDCNDALVIAVAGRL